MTKTLKVSYSGSNEKPFVRLCGYWLRDKYGLRPGDTVEVEMKDEYMVIKKQDSQLNQ